MLTLCILENLIVIPKLRIIQKCSDAVLESEYDESCTTTHLEDVPLKN